MQREEIKAHSMNNYAEITIWGIIGFLIGVILGYYINIFIW